MKILVKISAFALSCMFITAVWQKVSSFNKSDLDAYIRDRQERKVSALNEEMIKLRNLNINLSSRCSDLESLNANLREEIKQLRSVTEK